MVIGVTGVIGSGKSSACKILASMGAFCIDADAVVSELYRAGNAGYEAVKNNIGPQYVNTDEVDRELLREYVFECSENVMKINSLIHPLVKQAVKQAIDTSDAEIKIVDAPLLYEAGLDELCDTVWAVVADEESRIVRIMERDGCSAEEAMSRISYQHSDEFFRERADRIIENNEGINALDAKIRELLNGKK